MSHHLRGDSAPPDCPPTCSRCSRCRVNLRMQLVSVRALAAPALAMAAGGMAPGLARGAAASSATAAAARPWAAAGMQSGRQCAYRHHCWLSIRQLRSSSQQTRSSTLQGHIHPQPRPLVRCMATDREQAQDDSSSNGSGPASSGDSGQGSCQKETLSGQPEVGRGSLAPEEAKGAPPNADEKSMTYREMLADWFYTRSVKQLAHRCMYSVPCHFAAQHYIHAQPCAGRQTCDHWQPKAACSCGISSQTHQWQSLAGKGVLPMSLPKHMTS